MRWPPWESNSQDESHSHLATEDKHHERRRHFWQSLSSSSFPSSSNPPPRDWNESLNKTDWAAFTETRTLIPTLILSGSIITLVRLHRRFLRRFPDANSISPSFFHRRSIFGQVTSVGDGDNFRLYHTPGGRLAGWGWLPWKKVPTLKKDLKDKTVNLFFFFVSLDLRY